MLTIQPLNEENLSFYNQPDARFLAGDRIQLRFTRTGFLPEYAPMNAVEWRTVKPFSMNVEQLLANESYACFLAFVNGRCVGQSIAQRGGHRLCDLLDLRTDSRYRRQGVATALVNAVSEWAVTGGYAGLRAETTDDRPVSCQFFERFGFTLGGVDILWHSADTDQAGRLPAMRESVLTFYKFF